MTTLQISTDERLVFLKLYQEQKLKFPLIEAVLQSQQSGQIILSSDRSWVLILHKFGFAQLMQLKKNIDFSMSLAEEMARQKILRCTKLRLYALPPLWEAPLKDLCKSRMEVTERMQLTFVGHLESVRRPIKANLNLCSINIDNLKEVEKNFCLDLPNRFWDDQDSLLNQSISSLAYVSGQLASVCYACAIASNVAEIDVYTAPQFRKQGIGFENVLHFLNLCKKRNVVANWDCYTNNLASLSLAKKAGFVPKSDYKHAIIK